MITASCEWVFWNSLRQFSVFCVVYVSLSTLLSQREEFLMIKIVERCVIEKGSFFHSRLIYIYLQPYTSKYEGIRLSLQRHGNPKRFFSAVF